MSINLSLVDNGGTDLAQIFRQEQSDECIDFQ